MSTTLRFLREYVRPRTDAVEIHELRYDREGEPLTARLYRPAGRRGSLPTWIMLHGLTWHGAAHPSLHRFARAVSAAGAAVLVPDVPEWRRLEVAPAVTAPSLSGAIDAACEAGITAPGRVAALGFSFGATQLLAATAADPALAERLYAIAAWGGYCDLRRLFRFGFSGEYEHDGVRYRAQPDPYGAWIMGANFLTRIPGYASHDDVADALARLAHESGRRGIFAGDAAYDPLKRELRRMLPPDRRPIFDAFAPVTGHAVPDPELAAWLTEALADAAAGAEPLLDPASLLSRLDVRTLLAHGREDRLVPFTETLQLGRIIPAHCRDSLTVTSLFAHSGLNSDILGPIGLTRETVRFVQLLHRLLGLAPAPR